MNSAPKQSGNLIQRFWSRIRDLYRELRPCRFSLGVALIFCPVFLCVAQGTEILRTVGEGSALGGSGESFRIFLFFFALMLWAVSSWYAARVLLHLDHQRNPDAPYSARAERHIPRILGVAPLIIVGGGFLVSLRSYAPGAAARSWLLFFGALCFILAVIFYLLLIWRRRIIERSSSAENESSNQLSRGSFIGLALMAGSALVLLVTFTVAPVSAQNLGMGTILFLAAGSWVTFGGFLVYLSGLWRLPVVSAVFLLAVVFSLWNDNHAIREVSPKTVKRQDPLVAFTTWYDGVEKNYGAGTMHPLYIVATEGGGIRAAYWTALVLGELQDQNPNFAPHLFAISGVSGGSLGAVVFDALLAEPSSPSFKFKEKAHAILGQDFLSPALASMLYPDLLQRFLPFPVRYFDRGRALELGWEKGWSKTMGNDRLAGSFVDLWPPGSTKWMPALLLNGTSVEKGNRIITSNLRVTNNFLDAEDAAEKLAGNSLGATEAACHIPLSTAAHMSARFTFVSPAGSFPDGSRIVDGGYFENSGSTTVYELATRIKERCAYNNIANVDVKIIMISNDPRKQSLMIAPAKPGPEPPGPKLSASETVTGHLMGEITSPLLTMLNTRAARGTYAQKAIKLEQRPYKVVKLVRNEARFRTKPAEHSTDPQEAAELAEATAEPTPDSAQPTAESPPSPAELVPPSAQGRNRDIFYFGLEDMHVPLPLGWMLSAAAAQSMMDQLQKDGGGDVKNVTAINEILKALPTPAPAP